MYVKYSGFKGLSKQLNSLNLKRHVKCVFYKILISPILRYVSEHWSLSKKGGNMLQIFERTGSLQKVYSPEIRRHSTCRKTQVEVA
jgi:hypothetical protein